MTKSTVWNSAPEAPRVASCAVLPLTPDLERSSTTVSVIDPLRDVRWKEFVASHSRSSVFHSSRWLRALRNAYGYDPVVITASPFRTHLTNGIVFCRIKSWLTGSRFVSLPFSDHCEPLVSDSQELDKLLCYTRRYVDSRQAKYVEIRPVSSVPRASTTFSRHLTYCFHRLDLSRSEEEIFRHFHKDCVQRKIRRAEREKLRYEEGTSEALLQKFYRLMVKTRRRQSIPPQPLAWFRALIAAFGSDLKIRVASSGDIPVASILTLSHKTTMTYKYGCSDTAFNKLGGMALLFWRAIQDAKAAGLQDLDLGRSDSDNSGLIAFKDRWGAESSALTYWAYPPQPAPHLNGWPRRVVKQLTSATPQVILETVGRVLYRHIG
jgi:CelD/BcsL family acetyltransferase involved in cellulose biosynthesis